MDTSLAIAAVLHITEWAKEHPSYLAPFELLVIFEICIWILDIGNGVSLER